MPYSAIVEGLTRGQELTNWLPDMQIKYTGIAERDEKGHAKTYTAAVEAQGRHTACLVDVASGDITPIPHTRVGQYPMASEAVWWCQMYELMIAMVRGHDQRLQDIADRQAADNLLEAERKHEETGWKPWAAHKIKQWDARKAG